MKLASVSFLQTIIVPGHGPAVDYCSPPHSLEYDRQTDSVRVGTDGIEVPRSLVRQWKRDRSREPPQVKARCELCQREFNNRQGLGGHMRQAHGRGRP